MALDIRPSPIAGTWYEGNTRSLAEQVDGFINSAELPPLPGAVIALIAPHAGHRYSGHVAGHAFRAVQNKSFDLIVILSPFHQLSQYPVLTTSHQAYATPLGNINVDQDSLQELQKYFDMPITPVAKDKEHSLEIELPFLQRTLKNEFKLLPLMLHAQQREIAAKLGHALAVLLKNRNALLVASTDLSHFYPEATANQLDNEMLRRFESFDPESIFDAEEQGKGFACGHAAVATLLYAAKELGANKIQVVKYATSGDTTKDYASVVGYGAAVITKS